MDVTTIIIVLISVLLSMTIHEAVHAFAGYLLGDTTAKEEGRLTLNPIAHIDPVATLAVPVLLAIIGAPIFGAAKPVPFNPERLRWGDFGAAIVAMAGPLSNFMLAAIAGLAIRLLQPTDMLFDILMTFTLVNIGFFVFNIIPFPPLDGSRFLYAVAPEPVKAVMRSIESLGLAAILIFIAIFYVFLQTPFIVTIKAIIEFLTGVLLVVS
ncbi:MAG TPA: site-2 protease family protein [Candidatus Saccharimonadales bacterium]